MHEGPREWAAMAVAPGEGAAAIEGILTFGILWLDWTAQRPEPRRRGLRLFVPEGASRSLRERAFALSSAARVEVSNSAERTAACEKVDAADAGNLESWLTPCREVESALAAAPRSHRAYSTRSHCISPPAGDDIRSNPRAGGNEVAICFRGLEFARWSREGIFLVSAIRASTSPTATEPALDRLMRRLDLIAARLPRRTTIRSIARRRSDGSRRSCSRIPRASTRSSIPAISIRSFLLLLRAIAA